jgi:hypothetical protein
MSSRFGVSEIGRDPVLPPICVPQPQAVCRVSEGDLGVPSPERVKE